MRWEILVEETAMSSGVMVMVVGGRRSTLVGVWVGFEGGRVVVGAVEG